MAYGTMVPYRRRTYRTRRRKPRLPSRYDRPFSGGWYLRRAIAGYRYLRSMMNVEFKYKDVTASPTVSNTGTLVLLNGMSKGDTVSTREARSILCKSSEFKTNAYMNASATNTSLRVILFIDKQPSGTAPTIANLLQSNTITSFRHLDFRKRFVILIDRSYSLSVNGKNDVHIEWYKKLRMHTIYDDSDAGDITDISSNALYLVLISNEPTNTPTVVYNHRLRFIDN